MAIGLYVPLLQDDLLFFVEAFENFGLDAVGDAELHTDFLFAVFGFRVGSGGGVGLAPDRRAGCASDTQSAGLPPCERGKASIT